MAILNTFAPGYARTEEGWIDFPRGIQRRKEVFPQEQFQHPAKANPLLIEALVEYLTKPGETILDPMSGVGTIQLAVLAGRRVICIEDAAVFHYIQTLCKDKLMAERGVKDGDIVLLHGPCQEYLPVACDHIIFSPPYADTIKSTTTMTEIEKYIGHSYLGQGAYHGQADYLGTKKNLGRMDPFHYNMEMARIYRLLLESVRPGGTMTIIIQDKMHQGKRVKLSEWAMMTSVKSGWEMMEWHKKTIPGTPFKTIARKKGWVTVDDEDIIVLRRPV